MICLCRHRRQVHESADHIDKPDRGDAAPHPAAIEHEQLPVGARQRAGAGAAAALHHQGAAHLHAQRPRHRRPRLQDLLHVRAGACQPACVRQQLLSIDYVFLPQYSPYLNAISCFVLKRGNNIA